MELLEEIRKVIDLVEENPDSTLYSTTVIDLEELINFAIEIGKLAAKSNVANTPYKFPTDPKLVEIYNAYIKLLDLLIPIKDLTNYNNLIHIGTPTCKLFSEINMICQVGEYIDPGGEIGERKKILLCKIAKLGLEVESKRKLFEKYNDTHQIYIDEKQYILLKELYNEYITQEKKQQLREAVKKVFELIEYEYNRGRNINLW